MHPFPFFSSRFPYAGRAFRLPRETKGGPRRARIPGHPSCAACAACAASTSSRAARVTRATRAAFSRERLRLAGLRAKRRARVQRFKGRRSERTVERLHGQKWRRLGDLGGGHGALLHGEAAVVRLVVGRGLG